MDLAPSFPVQQPNWFMAHMDSFGKRSHHSSFWCSSVVLVWRLTSFGQASIATAFQCFMPIFGLIPTLTLQLTRDIEEKVRHDDEHVRRMGKGRRKGQWKMEKIQVACLLSITSVALRRLLIDILLVGHVWSLGRSLRTRQGCVTVHSPMWNRTGSQSITGYSGEPVEERADSRFALFLESSGIRTTSSCIPRTLHRCHKVYIHVRTGAYHSQLRIQQSWRVMASRVSWRSPGCWWGALFHVATGGHFARSHCEQGTKNCLASRWFQCLKTQTQTPNLWPKTQTQFVSDLWKREPTEKSFQTRGGPLWTWLCRKTVKSVAIRFLKKGGCPNVRDSPLPYWRTATLCFEMNRASFSLHVLVNKKLKCQRNSEKTRHKRSLGYRYRVAWSKEEMQIGYGTTFKVNLRDDLAVHW